MNDEYNGYITEAPVNHLCLCSGYDGVGRGLRNLFPNLRTCGKNTLERITWIS